MFEALDLNSVDELMVSGSLDEALGDALEHGGIEVGVFGKGGGDSVGGERYDWG